MLSNNKATASRYFEYKTKIKGEAAANNHVLNTKAVLPLKYLSNFWKSLDQPFINCEIELHLTWSEDSIISEMLSNPEVPALPATNLPIASISEGSTTDVTFEINSTKLYVSVVTFFINDNVKFSENIKQRFKKHFLEINIALK